MSTEDEENPVQDESEKGESASLENIDNLRWYCLALLVVACINGYKRGLVIGVEYGALIEILIVIFVVTLLFRYLLLIWYGIRLPIYGMVNPFRRFQSLPRDGKVVRK